MKRKVAHSEEERKAFIAKGFKEVGREENGNYVFWSNKMTDILSKREIEVFELQDKKDIEIAELLGVSEKTVISYRKKIEDKGFFFDADAVINWGEISRILSGNRSVVTKKRMPKRHEENVNELRQLIRMWGFSFRS
jgi:hypothetical protein